MNDQGTERIRIDKWLWFARFFKSRTLAAAFVKSRKVRLNGVLVSKANSLVTIGDTLTFPKADHIVVAKILKCGVRRGPYIEAQTLYEDLSPPKPSISEAGAMKAPSREKGMGRPTKADRRAIDKLHGQNE